MVEQTQFERIVDLIGASNLKSVAHFFKKDDSTIYRWKKKGDVPKKYVQIAEEYNIKLVDAFNLINEIPVTQVEIAKAYGVDPLNMSKRKKNHPEQYHIIKQGVRMGKVLKKGKANI